MQMSYEEFQRHIGKAGLNMEKFARLMDMHPASVRNKRVRGVPHHLAVIAVLIGELAEIGVDYQELLKRNGLGPGDTATSEEKTT